MIVNKWNFEKRKYDIVAIPEHWFVVTNAPLGIHVDCVACGRDLLVDDAYTSYQYQDSIGFGYLICGDCCEKEQKLRLKYKNE